MSFRRLMFSLVVFHGFVAPVWAEDSASSSDPISTPFKSIPVYDPPSASESESESESEEDPPNPTETNSQPPAPRAVPFLVGKLGDAQAIEFEGNHTFDTKQLRQALELDLSYQAAARPSNSLADLLDTLEERLTEGYLHCGFPEVNVAAKKEADKIVVQVNEGPRHMKGRVRLVGSDTIDETALVEWLMSVLPVRNWRYAYGNEPFMSPGENASAAWQIDEPVRYSRVAKQGIEFAIQHALIELGFPYTRFATRFVPNDDGKTADLVIEVTEDRLPSVVDTIEIVGLKRDTREDLLTYLGIAPGDRFDAALLAHIDERLAYSCRYWQRRMQAQFMPKVDGRYDEAGDGVRLMIKLDEYSHAPPLDKPLSPEDEILRKAAEWLRRFSAGETDQDLCCRGKINNLPPLLDGTKFKQLVISPRKGLLFDAKLPTSNNWAFDHAAIITPEVMQVANWQANARMFAPNFGILQFRLLIQPTYDRNGHALQLNFAPNLKARSSHDEAGKVMCEASIEPVAMIYLAHRDGTQASIENGKLVLNSPSERLQFDAETGAFISLQVFNDNEGEVLFSATMQKDGFVRAANAVSDRAKEFPDHFRPDQPLHSILDFIQDELAAQPFIERRPDWIRVGAIVRTALEHHLAQNKYPLLDWLTYNAGNREEPLFHMPTPSKHRTLEFPYSLTEYAPWAADNAFPRGSWPWTLARELSFYYLLYELSDETSEDFKQAAFRELGRLFHQNTLGPVAFYALARTFSYDPDYAAKIARLGLKNLSDEAFLRDAKLLTDGDSGLAKLSRGAVEQFWQLSPEDQASVLSVLPAEARAPAKQLIKIHDEKPDIEAGAALIIVLLDAWHDSWRDIVKDEFERIATGPAEIASSANDVEEKSKPSRASDANSKQPAD